ncbi:PAS domain-containing protein [Kordiimonas sp.]|uniref:PAS domain-containing protein n=1 Tax=Kordiimonas sp. TaxID=1970157 RepID=UPI003A8F9EF0
MLACFEPFITYWQALRSDALVPTRADFNPVRVKEFMGRIVIVERLSRDHFYARLVGTEIVERVGREQTGADFLTLLETPEGREEQLAFYNAVLDKPCGAYGKRNVITSKGTYHAKFLLLPISHQASHAGEFFAVFDFNQSLAQLSGVKFERFGALVRQVMLDIGAGVPEAYAHFPHEPLSR